MLNTVITLAIIIIINPARVINLLKVVRLIDRLISVQSKDSIIILPVVLTIKVAGV